MIKYNFDKSFVDRYKAFLSSEAFSEQNSYAKTEYWRFHADNVNVDISGESIIVAGESGFYAASNHNKLQSIFRRIGRALNNPKLIKDKLRKKLGMHVDGIRLHTYVEAFDKVMSHHPIADPDLSPFRIDFRELAKQSGVYASLSDIQNSEYIKKTGSVTNHLARTFYYKNIISGTIGEQNISKVLEIGGGNGNLLGLIKQDIKPSLIVDVDLPETLIHAIPFIANAFPDASILMPHEVTAENIESCDFAFITPAQINLLEPDTFDLAINVCSMQEMTHQQVDDYFALIQDSCRNNGYFFTTNRVEKIPTGDSPYTVVSHEPPNRFSEFPWVKKNETIVYEVCRLARLCQLDNIFVRIDKIIKKV